jgi:staphylococcal nuclease domain-containing protein 1
MAKSEGAGLWSEDLPQAVSVMDLNSASSDKVGKTLKGVIEQVRDASTLRVVLTDGPTMELITVFVSGIRAPSKDEEFADEARFFVESRLLQQEIELIIEGIASNSGKL